jgi:hypothetical protein
VELNAGDIEELTLIAAKAMIDASKLGKSLIEIDLDPMKRYQLKGVPGAGKILVVFAGGTSIDKLKTAINEAF